MVRKGDKNRIWNLQELQEMPECKENIDGDFVPEKYKNDYRINKLMLGKPVQWCKDKGYTVTDKMIAKPEPTDEEERELLLETVEEVGVKLKERLDKGEIGITLRNGTTLKVGGLYKVNSWKKNEYIKILAIGKTKMFIIDDTEQEDIWTIDFDDEWLPYEPKEETKPLERYQKFYVIYFDKTLMEKYGISKDKIKVSSNNIANVYSEQEAIDLGLKI